MSRRFCRHLTTAIMLAVLTLAIPLTVLSAMPRTINYQGYLTASDGTPVNRSVTMQLSLYDSLSGGTLLWTEQQSVPVAGGQYSVNLDSASALALPFDKPYYLGVTLDADLEMAPRLLMTSSPYALHSAAADSVADSSVGSTSIVNGAVTAAKLGISCVAGQVLITTTNGWGCGTVSSGTSGTITSIIAGNGLSGAASSGGVQLDVNFAGTGTAITVARSDHNHDAVYQKKWLFSGMVVI